MKEVVALGVAWIKAREVWRPESSIGRCRAVVMETAGHRRYLLACRYTEICFKINQIENIILDMKARWKKREITYWIQSGNGL